MFRDLYPRSIPIEQLVEACSLQEFLDRDAKRLSGGQRQRLLLAIALINDPEIVFLDEPTTGLDPQARRNFWKLIREIGERGKTVVLTTHYMEEAYELCDEILIMDHGKIIAEGTPDSLLAKHFNDVVVQLPADDLPEHFDARDMDIFRANGSVEIVTSDVNAAIEMLMSNHVSLKRLKVRQRTLEDLFLELTGKELRDES
jgi:ABC-2 type transport system ATP-binding protein